MTYSTTSSTSHTDRSASGLETPVKFVKGVGPKLERVFNKRGIYTVDDLFRFYPRDYEDRSKPRKIIEAISGEKSSFQIKIIGSRIVPLRKRKPMFEVRAKDESGNATLRWFHVPKGIKERLKSGTDWIVTGTPKKLLSGIEIIHPELSSSTDLHHKDRIVPIYREIEGLSSRLLRTILWNALEKFGSYIRDDLPASLVKERGLLGYKDSIRLAHFPDQNLNDSLEDLRRFRTQAQIRLIYDEFTKFQVHVLRKRLELNQFRSPALDEKNWNAVMSDLISGLPFELTLSQRKVLDEIRENLTSNEETIAPMHRLVQGDVGSGKTIVSLLAACAWLAEGYQVALMAPTELLAAQHFQSAQKFFEGRIDYRLLTGSTPKSDRAQILEDLQKGKPILLIGTHALIEDPVEFKRLGLAMIDEQHRFGVDQRGKLFGKNTDLRPHTLLLTATPIPRTLAMSVYGDLRVSSIREKPPGRQPVQTHVVPERWKARAYQKIKEQIDSGRQAYFVYPLVDDSESEKMTAVKSATQQAKWLQEEVFPKNQVALLHGQMNAEEKASVMKSFKAGEFDVLVSTTVIEVGVDVPNATVMVIEHSNRFGLSQLHQLRGRIGRGQYESFCFLFCDSNASETARARLEALEQTEDGFRIAEVDLKLRGPGEFLGTRQSGDLPFEIADLIRDSEYLEQARDDAIELLDDDPSLVKEKNLNLNRYLKRATSRTQAKRIQS